MPFGRFADVLRAETGAWLADGETRVLLSGMVGSRQGWVEAPYLPCPAGAAEIAGALIDIPFDGAAVKLVPGLCAVNPDKPLQYGEMGFMLPKGDVITKAYVDQWLHLIKANGEYQRIAKRWLD